jgi:hypothetical protein
MLPLHFVISMPSEMRNREAKNKAVRRVDAAPQIAALLIDP